MNRIPNPAQAHASIPTTTTAQPLTGLGYTFHSQTDNLLIQVTGGAVRMTLNGTNPTASLGFLIADGSTIELDRGEAQAARFITGTGTPRLEIAAYIL